MRKIFSFLLLTTLLLIGGNAWADVESVTFSKQGYSNGDAIATYAGTNFSITFNKGTNNNAPKYYNSGSAIRAYGGNYFTVSSEYTITKIVLTFGSSDGSNAITTDEDTYEDGTWTGSATSIKFTIGGTSGNRRLAGIDVTYSTGSTPQPTTFTVTYDANGANGGTAPTDATAYSSGATVTVLGNTGSLAKAGYIFAGWNENAAGTGADFSGTFTITQDTTLYAKWTAKTITGLSYTGTPTKTSYYAGESFASAGLTVTATFNDNSEEDVTSQVTWTPSPLTEGTTAVTGTYMGLTVNVSGLTVTVAPGSTAENAYTVAQAIAAIQAASNTTINNKYVAGIVSQVDKYNSTYSSITYWISDDGTTTNQFEVYGGLSFDDGASSFSSKNDVQVGDVVVVYGNITYYSSGNIYEFASNNHLVSLKMVAPTFYPEAGAVASGTALTISDLHTDADIYYTTDGTTPTTESTKYNSSSKPTITAATTFKAIAVKNGYTTSDVVTAAYTILAPAATPEFLPAAGTYNSVQNVTISTETEGATIYYTTNGDNPTTSSTEYTAAITVGESMTIKAIAVKDGLANSAVAEAVYTINLPEISLDKKAVNATAAGANGTIAITYENITISDADDFDIQFYDANQNELATAAEPDWVAVSIEAAAAPAEGYVVSYIIGENNGAARTAYMKVYALADDDYVYSELITISQAEYVAPFEITDGVFDFENAGKANPIVDYGSGEVLVTSGYTTVTKTWTAVNVTMTTGVASGNGYRWWNGDKTLRFYNGAYATFSVPAGNIITKIETTGANFDSADKGNLSGSTWTGVANSVKLSVTATRNIKSITVTYGTSATLTLGAGGWSTFAAPFAYTVSDNVTVYKAAVNNEKTAVVLSEVTGVIPANAGIILNGTEGAEVTITPSANNGAIEDNQLVGTITPKEVTADDNAYVISTFEDGTKFNKCGSVTIPAHKAYIVIEDAQGSAPIRIEFAENNTTDIKAIEASEKAVKFFENGKLFILRDGVVYDAMGKMVR